MMYIYQITKGLINQHNWGHNWGQSPCKDVLLRQYCQPAPHKPCLLYNVLHARPMA